MKQRLTYGNALLLMLFIFLGATTLSAQAIVLNAPTPADNPNLSGNSPWGNICAGNGGFNQYYANIKWAGTANTNNEFILELSDANGDFSSPTELAKATDKNTTTDFDIEFAIPTTTRGQGYKMRVRSTDPEKTSPESAAYSMYYMDVTNNLNISEAGDGVPPGNICSENPITLQVDNISNPETYQYIWYRSGTELTSEKGHTISVTQSGIYNAFIDYGPECTGSGNTDSNWVDVTIGATGSGIAINSPSKTALCNGDTETLTMNLTDPSWSYQWYKDSAAISGAITETFIIDASVAGFEGDYQVEISGAGICTEKSGAVTITNADNFTITRNNSANVVVLPSQPETLSVSTTAITPSYQWYRNNTIISGATNSTLDITQEGSYYVEVTQSGGTCPGTIRNSETTTAVVPASFEIIADYQSNYTACVATSIVLEVKTINAIADDGSKTDVTTSIIDSFTYQWKKDGVDISGATSKTISLTDTSENGDYTIEGTIATYNDTSDTLPVQLLTNETVTISSTSTIYCSSSDVITISTTKDLSTETYAWELNNSSVSTSGATLNVTAPGTYRLAIDKNGCTLYSNEVVISTLDPSLITLDVDGEIIFPEGSSKTVTASGGTAYRWLDTNGIELGSTNSYTFTQEGEYVLIANIDNCEISKPLTVVYQDLFNVPNVITPNGDGANDQWVIPNTYSNKQDINVVIYTDKGVELLNENGYQNNWPESTTTFAKQNMVFYYVIKNANETLKQGTITVIR
ncbi:gliding motility-associated-like protein [Maribacter vaceletii]|uniref:Gliding motility-associated-like protein n=1 Tax=Maribacter vaceletii TaxID=1206816 RepID=A0A495EE37_9FLAO|nr:gliding motility-associated C-terminal domain-containing protein [Maribacter vaceletii]RKR14813.1 gliding motility-associated-like protein [Maribacter vaceletii]